jgi:hypothetical protein
MQRKKWRKREEREQRPIREPEHKDNPLYTTLMHAQQLSAVPRTLDISW